MAGAWVVVRKGRVVGGNVYNQDIVYVYCGVGKLVVKIEIFAYRFFFPRRIKRGVIGKYIYIFFTDCR